MAKVKTKNFVCSIMKIKFLDWNKYSIKTIISFVFIGFFLISCRVTAPDLVIIGVQTQEALSFLEQYQQGVKKEGEFDVYLNQLRANYSPGFEWDQYWFGIKQKKLYEKLKDKELEQLFSLNKISCEHKNWSAFSKLLLEIAESDPGKLLFSKYLTDLRRTCFTWLPNPDFKAILKFLSDKRDEEEWKNIGEEHKAYFKSRENDSNFEKDPEPQKTTQKHIYTEELKKVLIDERRRRHTARDWNDVLEAVDRTFWADARWLSYQSKNRDDLRDLLEMEWKTYKYIRHGLKIDVLLMFEEENKMEDIIRQARYKNYFSNEKRRDMDWEALWKSISRQYPKKPDNGNVDALLSLYEYSSCQDKEELSNYVQVANQWEQSSYIQLLQDFCENLRKKQLRDFVGASGIRNLTEMAKELYAKMLGKATEDAERAGEEVRKAMTEKVLEEMKSAKYRLLDESLSAPPKKIKLPNVEAAMTVETRGFRTLEEAQRVLSAYKKEQYDHPKEKWGALLDKHFSERDWLFVMRSLRIKKDHLSLSAILDMHYYIYGKISFLERDIKNILIYEDISLKQISDQYGYSSKYLDAPEIQDLFWKKIKSSLEENPEALRRAVLVYEEGKSDHRAKEWAELLEKYFSEEDWLNLMKALRVEREKALLSKALAMHSEIYNGKIPFLQKDIQSILASEDFSIKSISSEYGYPSIYLNEDIDDLFWQKLKRAVKEYPGNLKKALLVYEEEKAERSTKEWFALFRKYFVEEDWLGLMEILRGKRDQSSLARVLKMHSEIHEVYNGRIAFFKKDIQRVLLVEDISIKGISKKYGYPSAYLNEEIYDLFWQKLKKSLKRNPGNLKKALLVYEEEKTARSPKEWAAIFEKHFSEEDWLNLMKALRAGGNKLLLTRVLDMHYEIYEGKIPFLRKDVQAILASESLSLTEIEEKYGYKKAYMETLDVQGLFWQGIKNSLKKDPKNLLDALTIYERGKADRAAEEWAKLFEEYFSEQDWLNLMKALRAEGNKLLLSKVLAMHSEVHDGKIPFLKKDMEAVLTSEDVSIKQISSEYGYPSIYLDEEVYALFWQKIKNSLKENPGHLVKALSVYEEEKADRTAKEWAALFEQYFTEEDWLSLMQVLRNKKSRFAISQTLKMHYEVYEGHIPFLNNDLYAVLQAGKPSLKDITDVYGYGEEYVNEPKVKLHFWQDVENSIGETEVLNWKTAFQSGDKTCSYSYIKDLFLFFSEVDHQEVLLDSFQFKNCTDFITAFKKKEWSRLVQIVHQKTDQSETALDSNFVWWLARVLFLYSGESDFFIKRAVSKISEEEWNNIIKSLLNSHLSKNSVVSSYLFNENLSKVKLAYNKEVEPVICSFFSQEKSHFLIKEYDPKEMMRLFNGLFWDKTSNTWRKREYCQEILSTDKRRALLYELSDSLFKQKVLERAGGAITDVISDIWSVAVQVMDLSVKMGNGHFYIKYLGYISGQMLSVAGGDKVLVLDHLTNHVWNKPPVNFNYKAYRELLKEAVNKKREPYSYPPGENSFLRPVISQKLERKNKTSFQIVSALSYDQKSARQTLSESQRAIQSLPLDSGSDYGHIFIEETSSPEDSSNYKLSVFGGIEIGNPYISSYFVGFELQRKIHSLVYVGLDYSFYQSKTNTTVQNIKSVYKGLDISYPYLKHAVYFNGHYRIFKSHLNLAGFYKVRLDIPLQVGLGFMNMGKNDTHLSIKWGLGPHVQLSPRWGTQFLFFQTVSAKKFEFLYTWPSLIVTFSF